MYEVWKADEEDHRGMALRILLKED